AAPAEPTPLSPYTNYPDLKPPSSPSPLAPAEATKKMSRNPRRSDRICTCS
ncbi:hypothetical protein EE612_010193, partial [Oryza sativa]